jgi:zinc transporter, ZIP family
MPDIETHRDRPGRRVHGGAAAAALAVSTDTPVAIEPVEPVEQDRAVRAAWFSARMWAYGLGPLLLLAVLVMALLKFGPLGLLQANFPPVEELTVERVTMPAPNVMRVRVVNGGPEAVTVAQVTVDDASWVHELDGPRRIGRLESRHITIPYPWVEGEPHVIKIVTGTGLTFAAEVPVATRTPSVDARYLSTFALIGLYVGVVPVLLGLMWLPFLRQIRAHWLDFFLAFTVGLLAFLGVDAFDEAIGTASGVPGAFQGIGLVVIGVLGAAAVLALASRRAAGRQRSALDLATLIALGIGLHNFGEGLAIGGAYAVGEVALGTFLVLGFLIHNTTEGLAIVAPLARGRPGATRLLGLGMLAGLPTIAGTWIGGFSYSPMWTTLFFAIGAGAIAQVVVAIGGALGVKPGGLTRPVVLSGFVLGLIVMYTTGLFVAA